MTNSDFRAWHERMGYTYKTGCEALGISRSMYAYYLSNKDVPRPIELACKYLELTNTGDL